MIALGHSEKLIFKGYERDSYPCNITGRLCQRLRTLSDGTGRRERSGADLLKHLLFNWFI